MANTDKGEKFNFTEVTEMQLKHTPRVHLTTVRMAVIKTTGVTDCYAQSPGPQNITTRPYQMQKQRVFIAS